MSRPALTPTQRRLVYVVVTGALVLAGIGFVGSYAAVRELAEQEGFGDFAGAFPIGLDAGIVVLLALDLLLAWLRMPFPLLRQTAWLLTTATIAFNAAAAWPDPLAVGMHAVIPVLFIVVVEAGRHAVGRLADLTADKHMESVRLARWLLSPVPTFRLWRRMRLWELRSYEEVISLEQDRLTYQAHLQARFGRTWRRKAPVELLLPLRLARYGRPLPHPVPVDPFDTAAAQALALAPPAAPERLELDLAPMPGPMPELTAAAEHPRHEVRARISHPEPDPVDECTNPDPAPAPDPVPVVHPSDVDPEITALAQRALELGLPLTLRPVRAEFGIGQTKAQKVIKAAKRRA
ncbi:DUF2637 domain-containing protein [Streptomyces sp. NPDC058992]|uniref:DUF2637 domain-containing protein n=1 Tax=Streptomyces sp. NPDC058992 TaxID=3346688 RepID=UPI0036861A79